MRIKLSDLWQSDGSIDRGPYVFLGIALFALKYNLDRIITYVSLGERWGIAGYFRAASETSVPLGQQKNWIVAMVLAALPFIWTGCALTVRRLRAVGLPPALTVLFFVPGVNLLFFALLAVMPSRPGVLPKGRPPAWFDWAILDHPAGSSAVAVGLTALAGAIAAAFGTHVVRMYGAGLFVGLPFALGLLAALLHGARHPRGLGSCIAAAFFSVLLCGGMMLAMALEGVLCLAMALPLAVPLATMGGILGYFLQCRPDSARQAPAVTMTLLLAVPLLMGFERLLPAEPPEFAVRTAVEINAPPEAVWRHVVSFAKLDPPTEWIFRTGIAYPIRADIRGTGPGAVRHCVFSTGAFVEPITVWDENRRLKFSVISNPPPMQEWTPYARVRAPHLDGFLASSGGQFLLTPLSAGRTRLEGTTWYRHRMWPAGYWRIWSDFIIHRIHGRVLEHVKKLSEDPGSPRPTTAL